MENNKAIFTTIAGKLYGAVAGEIASAAFDEFLVAVGFTEEDVDFESYFEEIERQIDELSLQLNTIQYMVEDLQAGQTDIEFLIQEVDLDAQFRDYNAEYNAIHARFETFCSATSGLSSDNEEDRRAGATLLYNLLSTSEVLNIDTSMKTVATALLGETGAKGIMEGLNESLKIELEKEMIQKLTGTLCGDRCVNSLSIFEAYPEAYISLVEDRIVSYFSHFIRTLFEGITLLEAAYAGTIQENQLQGHYDSIYAICSAIHNFWTDNANTDLVLDFFQEMIDKYQETVDPALHDRYWMNYSALVDPENDGGYEVYSFPKEWEEYITIGWPDPDSHDSMKAEDRLLIAPGGLFSENVSYIQIYEDSSNTTGVKFVRYQKSETNNDFGPAIPLPLTLDMPELKTYCPLPNTPESLAEIENSLTEILELAKDKVL